MGKSTGSCFHCFKKAWTSWRRRIFEHALCIHRYISCNHTVMYQETFPNPSTSQNETNRIPFFLAERSPPNAMVFLTDRTHSVCKRKDPGPQILLWAVSAQPGVVLELAAEARKVSDLVRCSEGRCTSKLVWDSSLLCSDYSL